MFCFDAFIVLFCQIVKMSGYPEHGPLCQRDGHQGRDVSMGEAQGPEAGGGLEAGNGK